MALVENWEVFFNGEEFATLAWVAGRPVAGLEGHSWVEGQDVDVQRTTFTCPSRAIGEIRHGESIRMGEPRATYQVVGMHPDGTGLTVLLLEKQN
jgi:hypothetical protein